MEPILIACSNQKVQSSTPVMAKDLYIGELFSKSLKAAICLSDTVYILSAGMGLLRLTDLVRPYDLKMTPMRAMWFRRNRLVDLPSFHHLLPKVYLAAVNGEGTSLFSKSRLRLGEMMEEATALAAGRQPLVDLGALTPTAEKALLETGSLAQELRTGPRRNICKFVGDLFERESLTIQEAESFLEKEFGPPLGISYYPTVSRQLRVQAIRRGKKIVTCKSESGNALRYHYTNQEEE